MELKALKLPPLKAFTPGVELRRACPPLEGHTPGVVIIVILLALGLFAMRTFWGPDFYDGHDAQNHLVRLYQFDNALKDGQVPPRWAGGLLAGRGYPVFIFAYPLPYFVAEAFYLSGFNLAVSLKLTFVLAYLISTIAMYYFATTYWQSRRAGFISALLWSWAPPIFEKIFIGAALGAVTSFAFIPLTFLLLYRLLKRPNLKRSIYLGLVVSFWFSSNFISPIVFLPLVVFFILTHLRHSGNGRRFLPEWKPFKYLSISFLLTLGLTAWFILPALLELKYTHFDDFVLSQYPEQFVSLKRLLYSRWGTDAPGWGNNPVSQQVGIAQWLAVGLAAAALIFRRPKTLTRKLWPFLIAFSLSIFLMLQVSQPVWDFLPLLPTVGIPWLFLPLAVFSAALSAGFLVKAVKNHRLLIAVYSLLIALALYGNRNHLRINEVRAYDNKFFESYIGVATGWNEHLPVWVKDMP